MPFGATVRADRPTRFRLWAPAARRVELRLLAGDTVRLSAAMWQTGDGWYAFETDAAPVGSLYRFVIDGELAVPDPASRFQPRDVHGPSEVIDPAAFEWSDADWRGRPWHETVLYELHLGTFSPAGTYDGAAERLPHLAELGVTAIELMPLAEAPGTRNWGYDGVLLYAPEHRYGRPEDLKRFVAAAHAAGLMVFVDVVYNHFGPEGNYLHRYAPQFFTERHATPWGAAIDFEGTRSRVVRDFFIHNALYWIEEFHVDGLRLDAVHAIHDATRPDILTELAQAVRRALPPDRQVHLVLENDDNAARYLARERDGRPRFYAAQWNDDIHHALHRLVTGEEHGYYADYDGPAERLGRALAEGFAYQGEASPHRGGRRRGEPSADLPPVAFVSFLQNHDQVGNRALGERIGALAPREAVRAAAAIVLLAPAPPLLFMGEEWGAPEPFPFFCDFAGELGEAVREGRRREFARFPGFADPAARARIPDPLAPATFEAAKLDWSRLALPEHRDWLDFYRALLALRRREIMPRLADLRGGSGERRLHVDGALEVRWRLGGGAILHAVISLAGHAVDGRGIEPRGHLLYATAPDAAASLGRGDVPPWFVAFFLDAPEERG
jgi:malto-oligosyltrehalose trehalohydrolase